MGGEGKVETPSDFSESQLDVLPCPDQSVLTEVTFFRLEESWQKLHVILLRPKLSKLNIRKTILTMYVTSSKFAPMQLKGIPTSMQNDVIFCKAVFKPILKAALLFAD